MTHPTPEQERAAEERLRALAKLEPADCPFFDDWIGDDPPTYGDLALLLSLVERQREEIAELRKILVDLNNVWRHEFRQRVDDATDGLFEKLSARNTKPFHRSAALGESNDA